MKIAFIYPGITYFGYDSFRASTVFTDFSAPIYSIALLSAIVEKHGHEAELIDMRFLKSEEELVQRVKASTAEVVGITVQTPSFNHACRAAKIAKENGKITIAGGIHATVAPNDFDLPCWDIVVMGEAEITLPKLLDDLAGGKAIPRLIEAELVKDLNILPLPRFFPEYTPAYQIAYTIEMSRGCPGKCTYCVSGDRRYGKKIRFRSKESIMAELERAYELFHYPTLYLTDVNASTHYLRFNEILEAVYEKFPNIVIGISERVDTFKEETARILAKFKGAGVAFGLETMSPRLLDFIKKDTDLSQVEKAVGLCKKYNLTMLANVLAGIPTQTDEEIRITYDYLVKMKPDLLVFNALSPFPGSLIYDYCMENNLLPPIKDYDRYFAMTVLERGLIKGIDYDRVRMWYLKFLALVNPHMTIKWTDEELAAVRCKILDFTEKAIRNNWRVGVFGGGVHTRSLFMFTDIHKAKPIAIFDNNQGLWGRVLDRMPILSPAAIRDMALDAMIISSKPGESEIYKQLKGMMIPDFEILRLYV